MRRITTYQPTIGETALVILDEVVTAVVGTFFPHPYYHAFCSHTKPRSLEVALERLERRHLVGARRKGGREEWYLTDEGENLARRLKIKLAFSKQKVWDGKWRLIIFDVPEDIRDRRDFLRRELSGFGLHQLQRSVWVTPHELPESFFEIMDELEIGEHLRLVTAEAIRGDHDLRSLFFPKS